MNKNIEQLVKKSNGCYFDEDGKPLNNMLIGNDIEKFANSLIQECCDMVNQHHQWNNPNDSLLVLKIKEKFGLNA